MKYWLLFCMRLLLFTFTVEGKYSRIFPEGKEAVYSYDAVVTTGTELPAPFLSQFKLSGTLRVQGFQVRAAVQLENLQYSMYSGDNRTDRNVRMVDLPFEAQALLQPFAVHYSEGKVSRLTVGDTDPAWSSSVKKALAGIFQFDLSKIHFGELSSFRSTEQTIHGECLVSYTVQPGSDGAQITKFYSISDCRNQPVEWTNNIDVDIPEQYELFSTSSKVYNAARYDQENLLITEVVAEGEIFYLASQNAGNKHSITVSSRNCKGQHEPCFGKRNPDIMKRVPFVLFKMLSLDTVRKWWKTVWKMGENPIDIHTELLQCQVLRPIDIQNPSNINNLQYDNSEFYSFKFSTNEDLSNVVNKILQLLMLLVSQLQGPNQLLPEINPQQSHLIPLLITYLRKLDGKLLEDTFNEIASMKSSSALEIFIKMLPLVGSKETSIFITKLIVEKKIEDDIALSLLASLPSNVRQTSEELLEELEYLLDLPQDVSKSVHNSAVLSFATMVYRVCSLNKCKNETVEKYTARYLSHMKENHDDFATQLLYISGLQNMRSEKVLEQLRPIILGEEPSASLNIRVSALKAVFPVIAGNYEQVFQMYWPVIYKRDNDLELRVSALELSMKAELNLSSLLQLHWFMMKEQNSRFYSIYYGFLKIYAQNKASYYAPRTNLFRQMLNITPKPVPTNVHGFYHKQFNISEEVEVTVSTIEDDDGRNTNPGVISITSRTSGLQTNYFSIVIKSRGMKKGELRNLLKTCVATVEEEESIPRTRTSFIPLLPLHIEYTMYSRGQATAVRYYNETNIIPLLKEIKRLFMLKKISDFSSHLVGSFFNMEKFFVTDIGMPGVLSADLPTLSSFRSKFNAEASNASDVDIRYWSQGSNVLKVKNTIVNIWQGIIKSHVSRFVSTFGLYSNTTRRHEMKFSFIPTDTVGFKWHTTTDIFTITYDDKYDALSESCISCKTLSPIINQTEHSEKLTEIQGAIYSFQTESFGCEKDGSDILKQSVRELYSSDILNGAGDMLSAGYFLEKHLLKRPITGSCGFSAVYMPNQSYLGPKICVDFGLNVATATNHYHYLKTNYKSRIVVNFGNIHSFNSNCYPSDIYIKVKVDEVLDLDRELSGEVHNVYRTEQCDQDLKVSASSLTEIEHISGNELERISISFFQLPEVIHHKLNDILKAHFPQHTFYESLLAEEAETELIVTKRGSQYYLHVNHPSVNLLLKDVALDLHPDVIQFCYKFCKYLMHTEIH